MSITTETVVAAIIGVLTVARICRLIIFDDFPPSVWFRIKWANATHASPWTKLMDCAFCLAPYLIAANMAWAWFSDLHWTWWVFNLWLALSYLAPIVVSYDQPES